MSCVRVGVVWGESFIFGLFSFFGLYSGFSYGVLWCIMEWNGVEWSKRAWNGLDWGGMVRYGTKRCGWESWEDKDSQDIGCGV